MFCGYSGLWIWNLGAYHVIRKEYHADKNPSLLSVLNRLFNMWRPK